MPHLHVLADAPDNRVLECAVTAGARYLITGDRELLDLRKYKRTRVITARAFLSLMRPRAT